MLEEEEAARRRIQRRALAEGTDRDSADNFSAAFHEAKKVSLNLARPIVEAPVSMKQLAPQELIVGATNLIDTNRMLLVFSQLGSEGQIRFKGPDGKFVGELTALDRLATAKTH